MTVKIEDVNKCHFGAEYGRGPLHVGGHSNAGRREVYREQNVPDRRHGFRSHSGFHNMIGAVLKTQWFLELSLKSTNHQARTVVTSSSFRTIGATMAPRISNAAENFIHIDVEIRPPVFPVLSHQVPPTDGVLAN